MNVTEYKKYHESFMENNHGSSLSHTFMCIYYTVQCSLKTAIQHRSRSNFKQYVYEYVCIVLPMILVNTVASNAIEILIFIDTGFLAYQLSTALTKTQVRQSFVSKNTFKTRCILSITCLRGLTYLITVFSILAVDFRQFPRYLAKTERFGYSLMDTGVGLFVLMSGLVHREVSKDNYVSIIQKNFKFITILVILGIVRFVSVKQLDYHEHITEYGVHWNFFFTLAVCKLLSSITLFFCFRPLMLSIFTIILHEFLLHYGLEEWVFSDAPRNSFVNANREGIASNLGYVSMYFFAVYLKQMLKDSSLRRYQLLMGLACGSILLCVLSYFVNSIKPTSRTLANAGYCLYLEFILVIVTTFMYTLEVLSQDKDTKFSFEVPLILSTINNNGLIYFLIGNMLTGLINMSIQTLLLPTVLVLVILNIYMISTLTVIGHLNKIGISV